MSYLFSHCVQGLLQETQNTAEMFRDFQESQQAALSLRPQNN